MTMALAWGWPWLLGLLVLQFIDMGLTWWGLRLAAQEIGIGGRFLIPALDFWPSVVLLKVVLVGSFALAFW